MYNKVWGFFNPMVVPVFPDALGLLSWFPYMDIYICRQVTHLQHTQLLGLAWLPVNFIEIGNFADIGTLCKCSGQALR